MGRETILFKSEEKMSRVEAAALLRQLAERVESGKVLLRQGSQEVGLKIPDRVEVEIKAEKEVGKRKRKKKLEIEIEWLLGDKGGKGGFSLG